MDVREAAGYTLEAIRHKYWHSAVHEFDRGHIFYMLNEIRFSAEMKNDKANRWLGWAQAVICQNTDLSLGDMKDINHMAQCKCRR